MNLEIVKYPAIVLKFKEKGIECEFYRCERLPDSIIGKASSVMMSGLQGEKRAAWTARRKELEEQEKQEPEPVEPEPEPEPIAA